MKVVYVISDINHAVYFEDTAISLRNNGINISFILINCKNSKLEHFLVSNNFHVQSLECRRIATSFTTILKVRKILKQLNPDIVHTHLAIANWVGLWAAKTAGVKQRIYTRHSGLPTQSIKKEQTIDKILNRITTKIIAISAATKAIIINQGVPTSKIEIVHHGFQLDRFAQKNPTQFNQILKKYNPEQQHPIIGVISRWVDWKGIQFIIPAFKDILNQYPQAKLLLFNADTESYFAPTILEQLKTISQNNFQIVAFENNIQQVYHLFDVFIHVPVDENCEAFGQIYIEALAAETPSVFTLSGIANEFISNQQNAFVVDYKNSEQIKNAVLEILNNYEKAKHIAQKGQLDVEKMFSFDNYIKNLIKAYSH